MSQCVRTLELIRTAVLNLHIAWASDHGGAIMMCVGVCACFGALQHLQHIHPVPASSLSPLRTSASQLAGPWREVGLRWKAGLSMARNACRVRGLKQTGAMASAWALKSKATVLHKRPPNCLQGADSCFVAREPLKQPLSLDDSMSVLREQPPWLGLAPLSLQVELLNAWQAFRPFALQQVSLERTGKYSGSKSA